MWYYIPFSPIQILSINCYIREFHILQRQVHVSYIHVFRNLYIIIYCLFWFFMSQLYLLLYLGIPIFFRQVSCQGKDKNFCVITYCFWFNGPVNNFSIMSGQVFLGTLNQYYMQIIKCPAQGHNTVTLPAVTLTTCSNAWIQSLTLYQLSHWAPHIII